MKRILHITGTMDRAGAETMLMNLYREIDRTKIQFDFVFFTEKIGDYEEEINNLGGKVYRILGSNPLKRMWALKRFLNKHPQYKIVHGHTSFSNGFHMVAAKINKIPMRISHSHNTSVQYGNALLSSFYQYISRYLIARLSTHFVSCGSEAGYYLFPKQKEVIFLPNSIDVKSFAKVGEKEKGYLSTEFGIDDKCLKIIQVGRIQTVKNHLHSLEIAEALKKNKVHFRMFFIGQGELVDSIQKEIQRRNLQEEVFLLGLRKDIPQLMAGADVMLMPSLHEGFPVVLVESQAVGLPAVISENITTEVDLGLGLVQFEGLKRPIDCWITSLKNAKLKDKPSMEARMGILKKRGFDVKANASKIMTLYNSMS